MIRRLTALAPILALVAAVAACGSADPASAAFVDLREGAIETSTDVLASGEVTLLVENVGEFPHTLVITDSADGVLLATNLVQPGETVSATLDLPPGELQFTCRIVTTDDTGAVIDHYQDGMRRTVTAA
ncbi:MAG TPA: hypothetical protein VGC11_07920 [Acidimicrobiia bacterium]|jgi:hypothetical protein